MPFSWVELMSHLFLHCASWWTFFYRLWVTTTLTNCMTTFSYRYRYRYVALMNDPNCGTFDSWVFYRNTIETLMSARNYWESSFCGATSSTALLRLWHGLNWFSAQPLSLSLFLYLSLAQQRARRIVLDLKFMPSAFNIFHEDLGCNSSNHNNQWHRQLQALKQSRHTVKERKIKGKGKRGRDSQSQS